MIDQRASLTNGLGIDSRHIDFLGNLVRIHRKLNTFDGSDFWLVKSTGELLNFESVLSDTDGHGEEFVSVFHDSGESLGDSDDHVEEMLLGGVDAGLLFLIAEPSSDLDGLDSLLGVVGWDELGVEFLEGFAEFSQGSFAGDDLVLDGEGYFGGYADELLFHYLFDHGL